MIPTGISQRADKVSDDSYVVSIEFTEAAGHRCR